MDFSHSTYSLAVDHGRIGHSALAMTSSFGTPLHTENAPDPAQISPPNARTFAPSGDSWTVIFVLSVYPMGMKLFGMLIVASAQKK